MNRLNEEQLTTERTCIVIPSGLGQEEALHALGRLLPGWTRHRNTWQHPAGGRIKAVSDRGDQFTVAGLTFDRVLLWPEAGPNPELAHELRIRTARGKRPLAAFEYLA